MDSAAYLKIFSDFKGSQLEVCIRTLHTDCILLTVLCSVPVFKENPLEMCEALGVLTNASTSAN